MFHKLSSREAPAGAGIEEVGAFEVGLQMDGAAWREGMPFVEDDGELVALVAAGDEGVGAGGLDHGDLHGHAAVGQREVFWPCAKDDALPITPPLPSGAARREPSASSMLACPAA